MNTQDVIYIESEAGFETARRQAVWHDIIALLRGKNLQLLSFEEVVQKLHLKKTVYVGLKDVPLKQIVGSWGRYADFTRTFFPKKVHQEKERWRQIYTLAVTGRGFAPIQVYQIDQVYFVDDGNHRVSVARVLGWETIQAHVTELPTVFTLTPNIRPYELLIKAECALFLDQTRLHELRPKADVVFTELGRYDRLLKQIAAYQADKANALPYPNVVMNWYDKFYELLINQIKVSEIMKLFPRRTADDLLAWLGDHRQPLGLAQYMNEVGYVREMDKFMPHLSRLSIWEVAKANVESRIKELLGK